MIRVEPVKRPRGFVSRAQRPGERWVRNNSNARRPKDLWSPWKGQLAAGFTNRCAYTAMYDGVGTVDHFVSWDEDRSLAYVWSNFRYASHWINASKQDLRAAQILDPYEIADGWFELLLPSLQLVVSATIPAAYRTRAEFTLKRLHLCDDERVVRQRRAWYEAYQRGELTLAGVERFAPLLARALRALPPGSPLGRVRAVLAAP